MMTIKGCLHPTLPLLSILRRIKSKPTQMTGSPPFRISQPYVMFKNQSGVATRPRNKFDDICIHFDTIPACDRQTATWRQE